MPIVTHLKNEFTPATYNNPDLTKRLVAVWKKELGEQNVEMVDPTMGGEDFSEVQPFGSFDSGGRFSCRRGRSGQGGRKPEDRSAAAEPALEQVRSRPRAHDSPRDHGNGRGRFGPDEEVGAVRPVDVATVSDRRKLRGMDSLRRSETAATKSKSPSPRSSPHFAGRGRRRHTACRTTLCEDGGRSSCDAGVCQLERSRKSSTLHWRRSS